MTKISVAIATYNEEKNITRCLESLIDWVSEIVVVDGSSTDKTAETARKYKAKVIIADNPPIFHINKQKAIDACHGDWILQLDADEVVSAALKDEIIKVINPQPASHNQQQLINGYWIPRKNFFLGKWLSKGGQYPDYSLRLYRKGKGRLPCKNVHEQAIVEGKTAYLSSPLLHYPYPNFNEYLEHFRRYTAIFSDELAENELPTGFFTFISYFIFKPVHWFLLTYIRHKGFVDGFPGFVFSLFSSLRFPAAYIVYWQKKK